MGVEDALHEEGAGAGRSGAAVAAGDVDLAIEALVGEPAAQGEEAGDGDASAAAGAAVAGAVCAAASRAVVAGFGVGCLWMTRRTTGLTWRSAFL